MLQLGFSFVLSFVYLLVKSNFLHHCRWIRAKNFSIGENVHVNLLQYLRLRELAITLSFFKLHSLLLIMVFLTSKISHLELNNSILLMGNWYLVLMRIWSLKYMSYYKMKVLTCQKEGWIYLHANNTAGKTWHGNSFQLDHTVCNVLPIFLPPAIFPIFCSKKPFVLL